MSEVRVPIGIDLGTTFSVVAILPPGDQKPRVVPNEFGKSTTPSVVCYHDGRIVVGDEAKELQQTGVDAAAFFKRAMGDQDFAITFGEKSYTATDLSALVLRSMIDVARRSIGHGVNSAVITVPAYFNNLQREATIAAGKAAGIDVLSIVNEPTAAARAYGISSKMNGTVLVYDLGGGTFDVSIVKMDSNEMHVVATDGDHSLGGKDFDDRLLTYLAERFRDETGQDLLGDSIDELLVSVEKLKRSLSARDHAEITLRRDDATARIQVERSKFESLTTDLTDRTRTFTERVIAAANLRWSDVVGVVPVGGSTRMPMIHALLTRLTGKAPLTGVQPDEAVALGAAIQAADELERRTPSAPQFLIAGRRAMSDVMSHSLGMIAISTDRSKYVNSILVRRNERIPVDRTRPYRLRVPRGRTGQLEVFLTQGETADPSQCVFLGRYVFSGVPGSEGGERDIDVTYSYDRNGVVQVGARDRLSGQLLSLSVEPLPDDVPARFLLPPAAAQPGTVYLVFDVSGSMSGAPLEAAQKAARAFIQECDLDVMKIGVMAVSDSARILQTATGRSRDIESAINSLKVGMTGGGNAGHPFDDIYSAMSGAKGNRYAVVLADGVWENQPLAVKQAKRCHAAEIEVFGVGFGGADVAFLRDISTGNGVFTDLGRLTETFSSIAQEIGGSRMQSMS